MDDLKNELSKRINQRINVRGYCVVYDHELGHIWPPEAALREKQIKLIERFAAQNCLAVTIRDIGINYLQKEGRTGRAREAGSKNANRIQHAVASRECRFRRNKTAVKLRRFGGLISTHTSDTRVEKAAIRRKRPPKLPTFAATQRRFH
jgi:hypothetical protein